MEQASPRVPPELRQGDPSRSSLFGAALRKLGLVSENRVREVRLQAGVWEVGSRERKRAQVLAGPFICSLQLAHLAAAGVNVSSC